MKTPNVEDKRPRQIARWVATLGPSAGLIAVWLLFALLKGAKFYGWENHRLMLLQTTVVAAAAIGGTLVIISGGIDLSVGSAIALGTMATALMLKAGIPPLAAAVLGIGCGFLLGLIIGTMIVGQVARTAGWAAGALLAFLLWPILMPWAAVLTGLATGLIGGEVCRRVVGDIQLSPFIVTLAMWGALRGAAKGLGDNQPIYPDQTWLTQIMQPAREGLFSVLAPGVWLTMLLAFIMSLVLRYTRFGRHVYAIGSNEQTARLCGVNVERTKRLIYGLAAACSGLAALMQFSFLYGQGDPTTADGYELKVIASVVIGGASLTGGEGTILGTLFGALIMTVVDNGCTKLGLDNWVQEIVTGGIILAAVALDQIRQRRTR